MKNKLRDGWLIAAAIVGLAFLVDLQTSVWQECRQTNSFVYCMQLMGSK